VTGAVLLSRCRAIEQRSDQPMLDLRLFRIPTFTGAQIVAFSIHASMFSMFLYITLYIQNVLGYTPLESGLRFLPVSLPLLPRRAHRREARGALSGARCS
jgi:predicted MFS family arabinose efflux permease